MATFVQSVGQSPLDALPMYGASLCKSSEEYSLLGNYSCIIDPAVAVVEN
jgi:hypothetical protein